MPILEDEFIEFYWTKDSDVLFDKADVKYIDDVVKQPKESVDMTAKVCKTRMKTVIADDILLVDDRDHTREESLKRTLTLLQRQIDSLRQLVNVLLKPSEPHHRDYDNTRNIEGFDGTLEKFNSKK